MSLKLTIFSSSFGCDRPVFSRTRILTLLKAGSFNKTSTTTWPINPVAPITIAVCSFIIWYFADNFISMQVQQNYSLKNYNTFGINVQAQYFAEFDSVENLQSILKDHENISKMILGGGSNILFTKDFPGLILKNNISFIDESHDRDGTVLVRVGAGINWHRFVLHCVNNNYGGVENLSLIPGNVGASPMQNIGAYGVEIKDVFHIKKVNIV